MKKEKMILRGKKRFNPDIGEDTTERGKSKGKVASKRKVGKTVIRKKSKRKGY